VTAKKLVEPFKLFRLGGGGEWQRIMTIVAHRGMKKIMRLPQDWIAKPAIWKSQNPECC